MAYHIAEAHYRDLRESYSGICLHCHAIKHGDVEPDAENYKCEDCGKKRMFGIEQLVISGVLQVHGDGEIDNPYVTLRDARSGLLVKKDLKF